MILQVPWNRPEYLILQAAWRKARRLKNLTGMAVRLTGTVSTLKNLTGMAARLTGTEPHLKNLTGMAVLPADREAHLAEVARILNTLEQLRSLPVIRRMNNPMSARHLMRMPC